MEYSVPANLWSLISKKIEELEPEDDQNDGDSGNSGNSSDHQDFEVQTPLKDAVESHRYGKVMRLLQHSNSNDDSPDAKNCTPLHDACRLGFLDIVELLYDQGHANIEARNGEGLTPLQIAASRGHSKIIHFLLEHKAEPAATGNDGFTALHCAISNNHLKAVKSLISGGADVNIQGPHRITLLHAAVENADLSVVQVILAAGADVNAKRDDNVTPLGVAIRRGNVPIIRKLLRRGGTGCGMALFQRALSRSPEVALVLLDHKAIPGSLEVENTPSAEPLLVAALGGLAGAKERDEETALTLAVGLLSRGVECHTPSPRTGALPLHIAAAKGWPKVTELLLKQPNIAVNARRRSNGSTPLWAAAISGNGNVIESLIAAGADVDAVANDGTTPLMHAASAGMGDAAELLVDAGASCWKTDKKRHNVMEICEKVGQGMLAAYLANRAVEEAECPAETAESPPTEHPPLVSAQ